MKPILTMLGLALTLAACGADGEPVPPAPKSEPATGTGIRVSGNARVGISVSRGAAGPLAPVPAASGN